MAGKSMAGFTLVELIAANVVAAVLIALAVPSYQDYSVRKDMSEAQLQLSETFTTARSEAIMRNAAVTVCASTDQLTCSEQDTWSTGWVVFIDDGAGGGTPADGKRNGGEELLSHTTGSGDYDLALFNESFSQRLAQVGFSKQGINTRQSRIHAAVCHSANDLSVHRALIIEASGRVLVGGAKPKTGTSEGKDIPACDPSRQQRV